jgi:peptidoglycan/xylan/chitin deacetylase (PgdA/CDA1 family)
MKPLKSMDVPILMYHHLVAGDQVDAGAYEISIAQFGRHLDFLQRGGFKTVSMREVFDAAEGDAALPRRAVVITFDDAFRSFFELGWPALRARGMTASLFVPAGEIGGSNRWDAATGMPHRDVMTEAEIKTVRAGGIEIGAHGFAHRNLNECSDDERRKEVVRSRDELQRRFGAAPEFFAYPYGANDARAQTLLAGAGYRGALSIFSPAKSVTAERFCVRRIYIHSGDEGMKFRVKLWPLYLKLLAFRGSST